MTFPPSNIVPALRSVLATAILLLALTGATQGSSQRETAIVRAVAAARPSIVNIQGQKTVTADIDSTADALEPQRVNGMGTGVIIDPRGYILTNHHVVEGVKQIQISLCDGRKYTAQLLAHDPVTDLALVKIAAEEDLPLIRMGTSADLMPGETVIAVGNAYGYEHTVTLGIISALDRTVQVSDEQRYEDLIQTDASINPGNSGGPLLNVDGEMIGINVAVRVGAQGIGFAIPVDRTMQVAADLMSAERIGGVWHGLVSEIGTAKSTTSLAVRAIQADSPAARAGITVGDRIARLNDWPTHNRLDLERSLIGLGPGSSVDVQLERAGKSVRCQMVLAAAKGQSPVAADRAWMALGLKLVEIPPAQFRNLPSAFRGGLRVARVRPGSIAAQQGIRPGDVLVGMHHWQTRSLKDVAYVIEHSPQLSADSIRFYILRGSETLYGHLPVSWLK